MNAGRATLEDLCEIEGQAELIAGKIVCHAANGWKPGRIAFAIARHLDDYAETAGQGEAYTGTIVFAVPRLSSGRESFSPDASYYRGPFGANDMRFIEGPPTFAAEVRSENDYGPAAEAAMAAKRADYFEAGTLAVWDVDPIAETVRGFRADAPDQPIFWKSGDAADAEPALPGWRLAVNDLFA